MLIQYFNLLTVCKRVFNGQKRHSTNEIQKYKIDDSSPVCDSSSAAYTTQRFSSARDEMRTMKSIYQRRPEEEKTKERNEQAKGLLNFTCKRTDATESLTAHYAQWPPPSLLCLSTYGEEFSLLLH